MPQYHHDMLQPREIREKLRGKIHPDIGHILVRLAEDGIQTRMMMSEIAAQMMQLSQLMTAMTQAMSAVTDRSRAAQPTVPGTDIDGRLTQLKRNNNVDSEEI